MYSIVIQYFYRLFSIKDYYIIMTIILCAIQYILVAYLKSPHLMGPNQTYKLLHSKGNHKQNEKTT